VTTRWLLKTDGPTPLSTVQMPHYCPLLFFLDEESPIHLFTDASEYGFGAHLTQIVDGIMRPIRFVSRAFDERMLNWDVPQKE